MKYFQTKVTEENKNEIRERALKQLRDINCIVLSDKFAKPNDGSPGEILWITYVDKNDVLKMVNRLNNSKVMREWKQYVDNIHDTLQNVVQQMETLTGNINVQGYFGVYPEDDDWVTELPTKAIDDNEP